MEGNKFFKTKNKKKFFRQIFFFEEFFLVMLCAMKQDSLPHQHLVCDSVVGGLKYEESHIFYGKESQIIVVKFVFFFSHRLFSSSHILDELFQQLTFNKHSFFGYKKLNIFLMKVLDLNIIIIF